MVFVSMQATLLFVIFECSLTSSNSFRHFMRCLVKVTEYLQKRELFYMNVNFFGTKHIMSNSVLGDMKAPKRARGCC